MKNGKFILVGSVIIIILFLKSIIPVSAHTLSTKYAASRIVPGTILCQPNASDWPQTNDWQTVDDEYVNRNGNSTPIVAPCNITVRDYSVEAKMRTADSGNSFMGIFARLKLENNIGYKGGINASYDEANLYDLLNSLRATVSLGSLDTYTVYSIKMQVVGTSVALYVNDKLMAKKHYTSANDPGTVAIECNSTCELLQFTVVAQ